MLEKTVSGAVKSYTRPDGGARVVLLCLLRSRWVVSQGDDAA